MGEDEPLSPWRLVRAGVRTFIWSRIGARMILQRRTAALALLGFQYTRMNVVEPPAAEGFTYAWVKLFRGGEAIALQVQEYRPPICRILVTYAYETEEVPEGQFG